jgi:hypothetical protein
MKKESTPFTSIDIVNKVNGHRVAWIHLFWSINAGTYGHQVVSEFNFGDYSKNYTTEKTSGCGYCKEAEALLSALSKVKGERVYTCHYRARDIFQKYHTGGNHYSLSMAQLNKVLRGLK